MTPTAREVEAYRSSLGALREALRTDLAGVWALLASADGEVAYFRDLLTGVVPELVWEYQSMASTFVADSYEDWRAEVGARGGFRPLTVAVTPREAVLASMRNALGPLLGASPDVAAARSMFEGMSTRLVTVAAGETVVSNTRRDPQAVGWRRVARAGSCPFCQMLAGRGSVYKKGTVGFRAHDHCGCVGVPSWDSRAPEVGRDVYAVASGKRNVLIQ